MASVGAGLGQDIYDGSAEFGRFMGWVTLFVGGTIGLILLIVGVVLMLKRSEFTQKAIATVKAANCSTNTETSCTSSGKHGEKSCETKPYTECKLDLQYTVGKDSYTQTLRRKSQSSFGMKQGDNLPIYVSEKDPHKIADSRPPWKIIGGVLLGFGILVLVGSVIHFYITYRFKFAAAASGVATATGMVADGIRD